MELELSTNHRIHLSAEQAVLECHPLGFNNIQIGTPHYDADIDVLKKIKSKLNLNYSVHAPFPATRGFMANPAYGDKELLEKTHDLLLKSIDNAVKLGARYVIVHSSERGTENCLESTIETLSKVCDKAGKLTICMENKMPPDKVGFTEEDMKCVLKEVGRKNLKLCFDTGHAIASYGSEKKALEFLKDVVEDVGNVHLVQGTAEWDVHIPPQEEPHFYRGLVHILDDAGYDGNLTFEAVPEIPDEDIVKSARYIRATIAEVVAETLL